MQGPSPPPPDQIKQECQQNWRGEPIRIDVPATLNVLIMVGRNIVEKYFVEISGPQISAVIPALKEYSR
jgi:hypothetical protein